MFRCRAAKWVVFSAYFGIFGSGCSAGGLPSDVASPQGAQLSVVLDLASPGGTPAIANPQDEIRLIVRASHVGVVSVLSAGEASPTLALAEVDVPAQADVEIRLQATNLPNGELLIWAYLQTKSGTAESDRRQLKVVVAPSDLDQDGFTADVDCDDAEPRRRPGGVEVCDAQDDDCDGAIDEECVSCLPGAGEACFSSPLGLDDPSAGRGACRTGWRVCSSDGVWTGCEGERVPQPESCPPASGDFDCDGLSGCDDPDCTASGCAPVEACAQPQDEDGDGLTDCSDPDCDGALCAGANGSNGRCQDTLCEEEVEVRCDDGVDDDADGGVDCEDSECANAPCAPSSLCTGGQCRLAVEAHCDDGIDNDNDGQADCADVDCPEEASCWEGSVCRQHICCPYYEAACGDGVDDDGDGTTDCADDDCPAEVGCAAGRVCRSHQCVPTVEGPCDDGIDQDLESGADCADPDCDGRQCGDRPIRTCHCSVCTSERDKLVSPPVCL